MAAKGPRYPVRGMVAEVCHSTLEIVVTERASAERVVMHNASVTWRREARSLADELAIDELAAAFKQVIGQWKLSQPRLQLALSPDMCVTRVVVGRNDEVRGELREIEERSQAYLLLGSGRPSVGGCVRQVDAKVQHALLAVVNQQTLTNLAAAAHKAGVKLDQVEPALVAVSRLVGQQKLDATAPVLLVQLSERGAEVGLTYQGQLLLEYRPAVRMTHEQLPAILAKHLNRLQRYCERYVRFAEGRIARVVLCGRGDELLALCPALAAEMDLPVEVLTAPQCDERWGYAGERAGPESCAALGVALRTEGEVTDAVSPNLLERLQSQTREPLAPLLMKHLWPVAAALLLGAFGWSAVLVEHLRCRGVERQIEHYEPQLLEARVLRAKALRDQAKAREIERIAQKLERPGWNSVATSISQCLPADVWLETVDDDGHGKLRLAGASYSSDGVYELVRWLRQHPLLAHVAVGRTHTTREQTGRVTEFEIDCELAGHAGATGGGP